MESPDVVSGLIRKRAEIAGQVECTPEALRKLMTDLEVLDSAIRLFEPERSLGDV